MALSRTSFPETVTMTQRSGATWRATTTPHVPAIDAVEAALDRDAAELSYRSCSEARFLHVFGRALFADVARMIDVDRKFR